MPVKQNNLPLVKELLLVSAFLLVIFSVAGKAPVMRHKAQTQQVTQPCSGISQAIQANTAIKAVSLKTFKKYGEPFFSSACAINNLVATLNRRDLKTGLPSGPILFSRGLCYYLFPSSGKEPPPALNIV